MIPVESKPAVSATRTISVETQHNRPVLLQDRRHKMTEEYFRKDKPWGEVVHPERKVKDRARITPKEIGRFRRVIVGILPRVKITRKIGMQIRRQVSLQTRWGWQSAQERIGFALLKKSTHLGCFFHDTEPPKSKSILRKSRKSLGSDRVGRFSKGTLHHMKSGKERDRREELFKIVNLKSAVLMHLNLRTEHKEKPCNKNDAPAENMGFGKKCTKAQWQW